MPEPTADALGRWSVHAGRPGIDRGAAAAAFPFEAVHRRLGRTGKQFVDPALLGLLSGIDEQVRGWPARTGSRTDLLRRFLGCVLDKHRSAYEYSSYIAADLVVGFTAPATGDAHAYLATRIGQVRALLGDVVTHEAGRQLHPDPWQVHPLGWPAAVRRIRAAIAAVDQFAAGQLPVGHGPVGGGPIGNGPIGHGPVAVAPVPPVGPAWDAAFCMAAIDYGDRLLATLPSRHRAAMALATLPVSTRHDEHLFLRVLQCFELLFDGVATAVAAARDTLRPGRDTQRSDPDTSHPDRDSASPGGGPPSRDRDTRAAGLLTASAAALAPSAAVFRLLATMRAEEFRSFRTHTEGASAIQSTAFKRIEVLCARPAPARLASAAFASMPEVVRGHRADPLTLDGIVAERTDPPHGSPDLRTAMHALDTQYRRWKRIHLRLAHRMLGAATGTGYTAGVPYLRECVDSRLFPRLDTAAPAGGRPTRPLVHTEVG